MSGARQGAAAAIQPPIRAIAKRLVVVRQQLGIGACVPVVVKGDDVWDLGPGKQLSKRRGYSLDVLNVDDFGLLPSQYVSQGGMYGFVAEGVLELSGGAAIPDRRPVDPQAFFKGGLRPIGGGRRQGEHGRGMTRVYLPAGKLLGVEFSTADVIGEVLVNDVQDSQLIFRGPMAVRNSLPGETVGQKQGPYADQATRLLLLLKCSAS